MAFLRSQFAEWREMGITQALAKDIEEQATGLAAEILNRQDVNHDRDQFLKGMLSAFSQIMAWKPELIKEESDVENKETEDNA